MVTRQEHDVYWGSHGCAKIKGHSNPCRCICGEKLPTGKIHIFGKDKDTAVPDPHNVVNAE